MKNATSKYYFQKIQTRLSVENSTQLEIELLNVPEIYLEAFWHLIKAGYPTSFVTMNYINLYEYVRENSVDYSSALKTLYSVYPGLYTGICIRELKMFELN